MKLSRTRLIAIVSVGLCGAVAGGCGAMQKVSDGVTSFNNTVDGVGAMPGKINDTVAKFTQTTPVRVSATAGDSTGGQPADNSNGPTVAGN